MATTRTDIHRPSAPEFDPTDYDCIGVFYLGEAVVNAGGGAIADRGLHRRALEALQARGITRGGVYGSRNCSHCGAHLSYAALMVHRPTNTYLHIGEDCLDNRFELDSKAQFQALRKATALNREQMRKADRIAALVAEHPMLAACLDEASASAYGSFVASVGYQLRRDGRLTDRQITAIKQAIPRAIDRAHQSAIWDDNRRTEQAQAQPAPAGRVVVTGKVLSIRDKETDFGRVWKMTVLAVEGYRVWVTVPSDLDMDDLPHGTLVRFTATLAPNTKAHSKRWTPGDVEDPYFAFGTRPTKASILPAQSFGN